jgi:hypothetical protein
LIVSLISKARSLGGPFFMLAVNSAGDDGLTLSGHRRVRLVIVAADINVAVDCSLALPSAIIFGIVWIDMLSEF